MTKGSSALEKQVTEDDFPKAAEEMPRNSSLDKGYPSKRNSALTVGYDYHDKKVRHRSKDKR